MRTYGEFNEALSEIEFSERGAYISFHYSEDEAQNELRPTDSIVLDGNFTLADLEAIVAAWKGSK